MVEVRSFKMPFQTNHFNANQRVWVIFMSGAEAALVTGKYRGKHRYVKAWVRWGNRGRKPPEIQRFEVDEDFAVRIGLT